MLLRTSNRDDGDWCRANCLFGDAAEQDPIGTASPCCPHHDSVYIVRIGTIENLLDRGSVFNMSDSIRNPMCLGFRHEIVDGLSCCRFTGLSGDHRPNIQTERGVVHDRQDVDGCVESRRKRQPVIGSVGRAETPVCGNENILVISSIRIRHEGMRRPMPKHHVTY